MIVDLSGIYADYEKEVVDTIEMMVKEYPILEDIVEIIHIQKMQKGHERRFATCCFLYQKTPKYEIKLNPEAFSNPDIYTKFFMTRGGAYYYNVSDVITHEMAHPLQFFYLCKSLNINPNNYKWFWRFKYKFLCSRIADQSFQKYFDAFFEQFNWDSDTIINRLGSYAYDNPMELLPECFNNYYHLKNVKEFVSGEQDTFEFVKAVVEDYKKYIPDKV